MDPTAQNTLLQMASKSSSGGFLGLSASGLFAGLLFSLAGYLYFRAGWREKDFLTLGTGIALMAFPYVITKTLYIVLVGAGIMALHYFYRNYQ